MSAVDINLRTSGGEGSGHTPGPWGIDPLGCGTHILGPSNGFCCDIVATVNDTDLPSGEANARLIAAAPELFEALSWFINDIDGTHTVMVEFDANVERARAAIAKAVQS